MATGRSKLALAVFSLVSAIALLALIAAFLGVRPWRGVNRYYVLVPDSIHGLEPGAAVKIRGVRAGTVAGFELYPEGAAGVLVALDLDAEARVHADTRAFMKMQGLTGLQLIDLLEGSPDAPLLRPGSRIEYGESPLQKLTSQADDLLERTVSLLAAVERTVERVVLLSEAISPAHIESSVARLDELLGALVGVSREARGLLRQSRRQLSPVLAGAEQGLSDVGDFFESARAAAEGVERTTSELQSLVQASGGALEATLRNLRETSESLRELARSVSRQPSRLLFSRPPPERELP